MAVKSGVSHSQILRVLKGKDRYIDISFNLHRKRSRRSALFLEESLMAWFREMSAKKADISKNMNLEKARTFSDVIQRYELVRYELVRYELVAGLRGSWKETTF